MKKIINALLASVVLILTQGFALAQTPRTWTGAAGDMNWSNPGNWQGNVTPGSSDVALFNNTAVGNCTITNSSIVYGLQVTSGYIGTITQSVGAVFYIGPSGAILNGGLLVINDNCLIWGILDVEGGSLDDEQGFMSSPQDTPTYGQAVTQFCSSGLSLTENQNYVRTQYIMLPVQQETETVGLTAGNQLVRTQYFDGLGRPVQAVAWQASPLGDDVVQISEYDINGLQPKRYLPYTAQECNGQFKPMNKTLRQDGGSTDPNNAFIKQVDFYTTNTDPLIAKTSSPSTYEAVTYAEIVYDNTPSSRILEQGDPGDSWRVQPGGIGNTKQLNRRTNLNNEVLWWSYDQTNENASLNPTSYYPAGSLLVIDYMDANKQTTTLYTDKLGRLLLKVMPKTGGVLNTYYIYDDFNQLRYIMPPLAVFMSSIDGNRTYTDPTYKGYQLLYAYRYDARHRNVESKLPGAESSKVVYDFLDRPVLLQDGNQAALGNWNFVKYDYLNRIVLTGLYPETSTAVTLQAQVNAQTTLYEKRISGGLSGSVGISEGYSNNVLPTAIVNDNILIVNYYDDYDFNNDGTPDYAYRNAGLGASEPIPVYNNQGQTTGKKVRILDNGPFLVTVNFYDKYARTIQRQSNNHLYLAANLGSTTLADVKTMVYDFAGRLLNTVKVHTPGGTLASVTVKKQMTYDNGLRLKNTFQQINNDPMVLLSTINYNELGQPIEKNLHSEDQGAHYLQSIDYRYNIRGWMTTINNSSLTNDYTVGGSYTNNDNNDLFGQQLLYDQVERSAPGNGTALNTPLFDGQISAVKWKTNNAAAGGSGTNLNERLYTFAYDKNYRLTGTQYTEKGSAGTWGSVVNNYTEQGITYDDGGNITTLNRYDGSAVAIDQLNYSYNGNQLNKVLDQSGNLIAGFESGVSAQAQSSQYSYDANGNLTSDLNKGIGMSYNSLNQITSVDGTGTGYTYDATGKMLGKRFVNLTGQHSVTTDYVDGFLYHNGALQYVATTEGRAEWDGTSFHYTYDLKDYLGSTRISFDKDPQSTPSAPIARVVQEDHYYAFGMRHGNTSAYLFGLQNNFLYTGKEVETESGLYDFGARMYDPALGRWHVIDPKADHFTDWTPYNFVMNNPVNLIDPTGQNADLDKAIVIGVIVVASIISDGVADEFGDVLGQVLVKYLPEDSELASDLGDFLAKSSIAASAGATSAALTSNSKFGSIDYWKDIAIGWVAGSAAGGSDAVQDEAGADAGLGENILVGAEKGALSGAVSGFTTGFLESIIADPFAPDRALKAGSLEGLAGGVVGGVAGAAGGAIRGLRGSNLLIEDEELQANINKNGWLNVILQDNQYSFGRLLNAYYYKGNFGGVVIEQALEPLIDKPLGDPLNEMIDLHLDKIIEKILQVRKP